MAGRNLLLTLAATGTVTACDDGATAPRHRQSVVEILPRSATTADFHLGDSIRLSAQRLTSTGAPVQNDTSVRFIWASSDTTVLMIDSSGLAEIVGFGSASASVRIADRLSPGAASATDTATASVELKAAPRVVHEGPVAAMAVSYPWHDCVLLVGGRAECRGRNHKGQLGAGIVSDSIPAWSPVIAIGGFWTVSTSYAHSCAMGSDGRPYCWGTNGFRNLDMELDVEFSAVPAEFGGTISGCRSRQAPTPGRAVSPPTIFQCAPAGTAGGRTATRWSGRPACANGEAVTGRR